MAINQDIRDIENQLDDIFKRIQEISGKAAKTQQDIQEREQLHDSFTDLTARLQSELSAMGETATPTTGRDFDFSATDMETAVNELIRSLQIDLADENLEGTALYSRLQNLVNYHTERAEALKETITQRITVAGGTTEEVENFIGSLTQSIEEFYQRVNAQVSKVGGAYSTILPNTSSIPVPDIPSITALSPPPSPEPPESAGAGGAPPPVPPTPPGPPGALVPTGPVPAGATTTPFPGPPGPPRPPVPPRPPGPDPDDEPERVNPLSELDYFIYDLLRGIADGIKRGLKVLWNDGKKMFKNLTDFAKGVWKDIKDGFMTAIKPLFSLQTAVEANTSRNLEKYIQAQSTNLLGESVGQARADARETILGLEDVAKEFGMTQQEQDSAAVGMSQMIQAIPDSMGLSRGEMTEFLAKAQAATTDLSGGKGMNLGAFMERVAQGKVTNEEMVMAARDPVLSRLVDPRKGRAITGNPVADMQMLMKALQELDQEVDFDEVLKSNPNRIIGSFFSKLYAPRTGIFGFLKEFDMKDFTGDKKDLVDTTLLDQITNFMTIGLDKVVAIFKMLGERIFDESDMKPVEILGRMLNRLAAAVEAIDVGVVAERLHSFFVFVGELFSKENIDDITGVFTKLGSVVNKTIQFFEKFGASIGRVLATMVGFKLGGVTGAVAANMFMNHAFKQNEEEKAAAEEGREAETKQFNPVAALAGSAGLVMAGTVAAGIAKEVAFGFFRRFALRRMGLMGPPGPGLGGPGPRPGPGLVADLGIGAKLKAVFSKLGTLMGPFLTFIGKFVALPIAAFAAAFGATRLVMNLFSKETESFTEALAKTKADFVNAAAGMAKAMSTAAKRAKDWWTNLTGGDQRTDIDPSLSDQTGSAGSRVGTGDLSALGFVFGEAGGILAQSFDFLVGGEGTQPEAAAAQPAATEAPETEEAESNAFGDMASTKSLISSINSALDAEAQAAPGGTSVLLSALNTGEKVFNQEQLDSIPNEIASAQRSRTLAKTGLAQAVGPQAKSVQSSTTINSTPNINVTINSTPGQSPEAVAKMVIDQLNAYFASAETQYYA